jgi:EH_Signature domain
MLADLSAMLLRAADRLAESSGSIGQPELVEKAAQETANLFHNSTKALPSREDARSAAIALLRGKSLEYDQMDMVAAALCDPVPELAGIRPIGKSSVLPLFASYKKQAEEQSLPRLTWYGLLTSYFKFDPAAASQSELKGWQFLRSFLQHTWPLIERDSASGPAPDWVRILKEDPDILGDKAANRYALEYLKGDSAPVHRLAADLGIPESSWYWQELVLAAVRKATSAADDHFKAHIPRLLTLIQERPVYRDEALIAILTRCWECRDKPTHEILREFVTRKEVWRNPKLKAAGIATSWNRVRDEVWRMALQWVNEANLRDFFQILAARNHADEGRLAFWSKYMNQIRWARLIFGGATMSLARRNRAIRELIAGEDGAYARISGARDLDAFMMEIGDYIIVEFSITGNAAYIYRSDDLKFDRYAGYYEGTSADLKYGYVTGAKAHRILHHAPWEADATSQLKNIGIYPDSAGHHPRQPAAPHIARPATPQAAIVENRPATQTTVQRPARGRSGPYLANAPGGASFEMDRFVDLVHEFDGACVNDARKVDGSGGRLWVENPRQVFQLEKLLKELGFEWAASRGAYYFREKP